MRQATGWWCAGCQRQVKPSDEFADWCGTCGTNLVHTVTPDADSMTAAKVALADAWLANDSAALGKAEKRIKALTARVA